MWGPGVAELFKVVVVAFVIMLVLRPFFLWYWRINEIVALKREQRKYLRTISEVLTAIRTDEAAPQEPKVEKEAETVLHLD